MSSLKVQYRFLYLLRIRKALLLAKSSNCIRQFIPYLQRNRISELTEASFICLFVCLFSLVRHSLHKLINELIILLPSDSLVLQSDVQRVIKQRLDKN